jgi:hypothetical protein
MHNELASNDGFGLEARGLCTGTVVTNNQIDDNDQGAVNLSHAKGVIYNG